MKSTWIVNAWIFGLTASLSRLWRFRHRGWQKYFFSRQILKFSIKKNETPCRPRATVLSIEGIDTALIDEQNITVLGTGVWNVNRAYHQVQTCSKFDWLLVYQRCLLKLPWQMSKIHRKVCIEGSRQRHICTTYRHTILQHETPAAKERSLYTIYCCSIPEHEPAESCKLFLVFYSGSGYLRTPAGYLRH